AVHKDVPLIPVRIENVMPTRTMEYFISSQHWFDAIQTPMDQHLDRMAQAVKAHLARKGTEGDLIPDDDQAAPQVSGAAASPSPSAASAPQPVAAQPAVAPAKPEPLIVGNYELTEVIATGRFGSIVYLGQHR